MNPSMSLNNWIQNAQKERKQIGWENKSDLWYPAQAHWLPVQSNIKQPIHISYSTQNIKQSLVSIDHNNINSS